MKSILKKYFNHYQLIYLFTMILFGSGFLLSLSLKLTKQPVWILIPEYYTHTINVNNIQNYLYFMIGLSLIIIFFSFHGFGVIVIGIITFLLGIHNGVYCYQLFFESYSFFKITFELMFMISQIVSLTLSIVGALEMSINVFAVSFIFKDRLKTSDIIHHCLNYCFLTYVVLFLSIILKIYVN